MRQLFNFLLAGIAFSVMELPALAADLKVEVRLIRGADDNIGAVNYKPVDPALAAKLNHAFKWKNYYEMANKTETIPLNKSREFKLSDHKTIRVKNLGSSRVEVHCLGHGKELCKGSYALVPPQWLVLGGDDTGNTAWFIGLRTIEDDKKAISKN